MCTVSRVAEDWSQRHPQWQPPLDLNPAVSREEFDTLKRELESLKKLLVAAKKYDKETGQPDCEDDEKVRIFKRLAELTGVDLKEVFSDA